MVGLLIKKNFTDDLQFDVNRGIVTDVDPMIDSRFDGCRPATSPSESARSETANQVTKI